MRLIGNREYLNISEAAEVSGFEKHYIYSLKKRGKVRTRVRNGTLLFDKDDLLNVQWERGLKHSRWRSVDPSEDQAIEAESASASLDASSQA